VAGVIGSVATGWLLSHHTPVYLGRISDAMYLLHFPLIMSVSFRAAQAGQWLGLDQPAFTGLAFCVTMITLFGLSGFFTRYIDNPSIALADHMQSWTLRDIKSVLGSARRRPE